MDLRQLTYFLAVVDHGGYHRAAEHLLISQPSLSQSISNLEKELGLPLFHRVGRGVVLSPAGADLVGEARAVLRSVDAARNTVDKHRGLEAGRVDLVVMPSPGIEPLATLVSGFRAAYPGLTIDIQGAFTPDETLAAVRGGSAEIGLVGERQPVRSDELDVLALAPQPLVLVVSPALDSFGSATRLQTSEIAGQPFIVSHQGSLMRWLVDEVIATSASNRIAVELEHRTSILPMVLAGIGHAVLPSSWTSIAHSCGLRTLDLEPATLLHTALVSRRDHLTPAAAAFVAFARDHRSD